MISFNIIIILKANEYINFWKNGFYIFWLFLGDN
jgi:hypothetical protein